MKYFSMCGIAGILSLNKNKVVQPRLKAMADAIAHRGPQGEGFWINDEQQIGFGHRRLCIIDVGPAGAQPMHYRNRFTIVYNGEIYNYLELKATLMHQGYGFTSQCDTEVVLAAYACWGSDCLQYFDGMFSFAIWDEQEKTLFCARDRFGEKPFYYHYNSAENELLFGSEMKALWAAGVDKKMRSDRLLPYLALGWVQSPASNEDTFYEDIFSLPPGHQLTCTFNAPIDVSVSIKSYWDIDTISVAKGLSDRQVEDTFLDLFTRSVSRRLRSDVAVGSSLSGGLDSSSIVAVIATILGGSSQQKIFSAIFPGFEKDESAHINTVVDYFNVENSSTTPTAAGFISDLGKLMYHQEEPFQSASIYAQYKVYELAKLHGVTVILDGQGADETLAGYTKYYHWYWQELVANGKRKQANEERNYASQNGVSIDWSLKNYLAAYLPQVAANQLERKAWKQLHHSDLSADFVDTFSNRNSIYKPAIASLNDALYHNTRQFGLEELLRYADRNSMAHSREVRLPFLSHELVQFVFSLPSTHKIRDGFTKYVLRKSMSKQLPDTIVWRKDKVGFEPPQRQWMQQPEVGEMIMESRKKLIGRGILKPSVLNQPIHTMDAHDGANMDWRYLCAAAFL